MNSKLEPRSWRSRYPSDSNATALVLPDDMPLHEAAAKADASRPHLVITERGECAIVPCVFLGMQKIAVQVDRDEKASA